MQVGALAGFAPALGISTAPPTSPLAPQAGPYGLGLLDATRVDGAVFSTTPMQAPQSPNGSTDHTSARPQKDASQAGTPLSVSDLFGTLKPDKASDNSPVAIAPLISDSSPLLKAGSSPADEEVLPPPPPSQSPSVPGVAASLEQSSPQAASHEALSPLATIASSSSPAAAAFSSDLPQPRRAYDAPAPVAPRGRPFDATRSGYEELGRGFDSVYDSSFFNSYGQHHQVFNGGYDPSLYGGAFDALYGADALSRHPNPYAQHASHAAHAQWLSQLGAMQDGYAMPGILGNPPAAAHHAAMAAAAAAAAAASATAANKRREGLLASGGMLPKELESLSSSPGGLPGIGLGGSDSGGVDFLQALFPNTRISVQPQQQANMPSASSSLGIPGSTMTRPPLSPGMGPAMNPPMGSALGSLSSGLGLGSAVPGGLGIGATGAPGSLSSTIGAIGLPPEGLGGPGMLGAASLGMGGLLSAGLAAPHSTAPMEDQARKGRGAGAANALRGSDRRNQGRARQQKG